MSELRNLLPNPKPASRSAWTFSKASAIFDDGMQLEGTTDNSYAAGSVTVPEAGDYIAVATLVSADNDIGFNGGSCMLVGIYRNDNRLDYRTAPYVGVQHQYVIPFTVPEDYTKRKIDVILRTPLLGDAASNSCRWARVGVFTTAHWQAMQEQNIEWFDGDSYLTRGGLAS